MQEENKSKEQLILEVQELRQRCAELATSELMCQQARTDLKESEESLKAIIDSLPDPTFVIDTEGKVIAWNRAMEKITKIKATDMLGKGNYEYSVPLYGKRGPMLIDYVLHPDENLEAAYPNLQRDEDSLIADNLTLAVGRDEQLVQWGKASRLYDGQGNLLGAIETIRDITDRKRAEAALKESEQTLAAMINFLPDATFVIDREGRVLAWNRAMEEMTGVKATEILGKGNFEYSLCFYGSRRPMLVDLLLHPNPEAEAAYPYLKKEGDTMIADEVQRNMQGKEAIHWVKASLLYDTRGNVIGAIETIRDVTDRKKMEEGLKDSERRLASIIDFLPDATFVINTRHEVIAWNRAMEELYGVNAADILGKNDYEYAIPLYGKRRKMIIDLVLEPDPDMEKTYPFLRWEGNSLIADNVTWPMRGKEAIHWGKASPLFDGQGNVVGAIETIRDITERKQVEAALKESEQRLASFIDFLPDPTFAIDKEGKVITWNQAMEELTGVTEAEMIGKDNYEYAVSFYGNRRPMLVDLLLNPDEKVEKSYLFLQRDRDTIIADDIHRDRKGQEAIHWIKAKLLYDVQGNVVGAIETIRDVTEIRRVESALRDSEERLAAIINSLPDATFVISADGKVIAWNRAMEEMTGIKAADMLGKGDHEYAVPIYGTKRKMLADLLLEPDEELEKQYLSVKREGDSIIGDNITLGIGEKGAIMWGKASLLYDNRGKIIGAIETLRDITERRRKREL